jgi:hypothetical protein
MATTYRITLKYPDGSTMFLGTVLAEEVAHTTPATERPAANSKSADSDGEAMTDPQKRYLFRLLAAQGMQGKTAEEHLRACFRVSRLGDISRSAASSYIDQLVKDRKDAAS